MNPREWHHWNPPFVNELTVALLIPFPSMFCGVFLATFHTFPRCLLGSWAFFNQEYYVDKHVLGRRGLWWGIISSRPYCTVCFSMMIRMQENPALILVMVQKSGDYQLRLVVYPILYRVLYIPVGSRQRGTEIGRSIFPSIFWSCPRF